MTKSVAADSDGQFSGGNPKKVTLSEPFNKRYADNIPQRAPEAPSEEVVKLDRNTHEARDVKLPKAPQAK